MTTYAFQFTKELKGFYKYELAGLPGAVYVPTGMVVAEPPAVISITADGLAEPKAPKVQDPEALQAAATKAAERAQRAQAQAAKLAAQVASLQAAQPTPQQPAARGRKAKAA